MGSNEKVYVINPLPKKFKDKAAILYSPEESGTGDEAAGARRSAAERAAELDRLDERGSPALAFIAYLFGPLSILATRRGRRSRFWISVAVASCAAAAAAVLHALGVIPGARSGFGTGSYLWLVGACLATLAGFTAWARGVFLVGRCRSPLIRRLPEWLKHPAVAAILGILVPGLGLFITGRTKRAVGALWMVSFIVIAFAVMPQAFALWHWNLGGGPLCVAPESMEMVLLAIAGLGALAALVWIVQALDGARLAGRRAGDEPRPRGDLAAVALLAAIIVFAAMFQPADLAGGLDIFAVAAREEGMRIIPLHAATAAMKLDPSRPVYVLHAIQMNDSLGRTERAAALRRDLSARWNAYTTSLRLTRSWVQP